jgi:hypothetical protein
MALTTSRVLPSPPAKNLQKAGVKFVNEVFHGSVLLVMFIFAKINAMNDFTQKRITKKNKKRKNHRKPVV